MILRAPVRNVAPPSARQRFAELQHAAVNSRESALENYRYRALDYIREKLGVTLWEGVRSCWCAGRDEHSHPGQIETVEAFDRIMKQFHERDLYTSGQAERSQLKLYNPDELIRYELQVPGGHSTGKSFVAAALANYFFDTFAPCVVSIIAPKADQAKEQILQEIKDLRRGKGLPGKIMDRVIKGEKMLTEGDEKSAKHYIRIATASIEGNKAGERLQGMHAPFQLIIMDEAEGIPVIFLEPLRSWLAGNPGIMLQLANPRSRTQWFHTRREARTVQRLTLSCLYHPNVIEDRSRFPGAVDRSFVSGLLDGCKRLDRHDPTVGSFELPWMPGVAWEPDDVFSFRVLGEAPMTSNPRSFVTPAMFEVARNRGDELMKRLQTV